MKWRIGLMVVFWSAVIHLLSISAWAELKAWYGFENAAYGTSLNGYTAIAPDYRINTGYAWVNTSSKWGVDNGHKIRAWASDSPQPWYPYMKWAGYYPISITAKLSLSTNTVQAGILTRYRYDQPSYTNTGIGSFLKATSGKVAIAVGTCNNGGSWTSVSITAAMYPLTFGQHYELMVVDIGGPGGSTLSAYFDATGNTPTTLQVTAWVESNASYPPYMAFGLTSPNTLNTADDIRLYDATGDMPTPTLTPTKTATPTPCNFVPGIIPIPRRSYRTWKNPGAPAEFLICDVISEATGNTLHVADVIRWTQSVVCADGTTVDCTGDTLTMYSWYSFGTADYDSDFKDTFGNNYFPMTSWDRANHTMAFVLNTKNGYPVIRYSNPTNKENYSSDLYGSWSIGTGHADFSGVSLSAGTIITNFKPIGTPPAVDPSWGIRFMSGPVCQQSALASNGIVRGKLGTVDGIWMFCRDSTGFFNLPTTYTVGNWTTAAWLHRDDALYAWRNGTYSGVSSPVGELINLFPGFVFGGGCDQITTIEGDLQSIDIFLEALTNGEMVTAMNFLENPYSEEGTPTSTVTPAITAMPTRTVAPTMTITPTPEIWVNIIRVTRTATPTATPVVSQTASPICSYTSTRTTTRTRTSTRTSTRTKTPTRTVTPTRTATPS